MGLPIPREHWAPQPQETPPEQLASSSAPERTGCRESATGFLQASWGEPLPQRRLPQLAQVLELRRAWPQTEREWE